MPLIRHCAAFDETHAARALVAVERQRVDAEVLAPERALERLVQLLGLLVKRPRPARIAQRSRRAPPRGASPHRRSPAPRRARSAPRRAPRRRGRPRRASPSSPGSTRPGLGGADVLDEAVAVAVAVAIDPVERGLDVRPDACGSSRGRRCDRSSGPPASRRAAWRPRCRSSGRTGFRRARPSRRSGPRAGSCPARRRGPDRIASPGSRPAIISTPRARPDPPTAARAP